VEYILENLAFEEAPKGALRVPWIVPHGLCSGEHSSGAPSTYIGDQTGRLHCRKCGESFGQVELLALDLGVELPSGPWRLDDPALIAVWDEAAARGWCEPRPHTKPKRRPRPARRAQPRRSPKRIIKAKWSEARVGAEFAHLRAQAPLWREDLARYATRRGWSEDIARALYNQPPTGVAWARTNHPQEAPGLLRGALGVNRPLLLGIYDAEGRLRSVSRRHAGGGAPLDELPKALAMSSEVVGGGFSCRSFGSVVEAVAAHKAKGRGPIILCEGGPDYLVASALARLGFAAAALAAESAGGLPKVGAALAAEIKRQGLEQAEILLIPDLKHDKKTGALIGAGLEQMRLAAERLIGAATVVESLLPIPHDSESVDLADIAAGSPSADLLWTMINAHSKVIHEAFPDLYAPNASGYLPKIPFKPGTIMGVRASLGAGKTQQAAELVDFVRQRGEVVAINHRRGLSHQLSSRLELLNYEDLSGTLDEPTAICLNSVQRLSSRMIRQIKLLVIDELEAVMSHLFGETLSSASAMNPNRPKTGPVSEVLAALIRAVIANKGMILCLDAHLNNETLRALRSFAGIEAPIETIQHITPLKELKVRALPSAHAVIKGVEETLEAGLRPILATDSRRIAEEIEAHLSAKGYRVKLYASTMSDARRAELGDVERAWSKSECDVVIYTPTIDAGVSYDPKEPGERFDRTFGLFTGGAWLPASTLQQMMFRARHVEDHRVYISDRHNPLSAIPDDITREISDRTQAAEQRLRQIGQFSPPKNFRFWPLLQLEASVERLHRLRTRHLRQQMLSMYAIRGAEVTEAGDISKGEKRRLSQRLKATTAAADLARAARVGQAPLLDALEYEDAQRMLKKPEALRDSLELSRLTRQFGPQEITLELISADKNQRITQEARNGVALRLALEGHWEALSARDKQALSDGYGARAKRPDLPILAAVLSVLLPWELWVRVSAPTPDELREGLPRLRWSAYHFEQSGAHLEAARLLDELAAMRGVSPDTLLEGIRARREDLDQPHTATVFVSAILRWIGVGTNNHRVRRTADWLKGHGFDPAQADYKRLIWVHRVDLNRWAKAGRRRLVESARQRGLDVDPLSTGADDWSGILNKNGEFKAPLGSTGRYGFVKVNGAWNVVLFSSNPEPGTGSLAKPDWAFEAPEAPPRPDD
ncbi:hypothetical protein KKF91_06455, partial [Myxococcota bacterium]|nr:hypothetical protein [Myxococcota bacterium]